MSGFMQLQVWQEDGADFVTESGYGVELRPLSYGDEPIGATKVSGLWWAEYTAPGYLDRTDPVYGETPQEAARECFYMYGVDEQGSGDRKELAAILWEIRAMNRRQAHG